MSRSGNVIEEKDFWKNLKIDYSVNSKKSFIVLFFYRVSHYLFKKNNKILLLLVGVIKWFVYLLLRINEQISYEAKIGSNIRLPHCAEGVVISSYAKVGNSVTIFHYVTIGINDRKDISERRVEVKDNCYLSTGCTVINCVINENCTIAPNAVVYKDLSRNSMCYSVNEIKVVKK